MASKQFGFADFRFAGSFEQAHLLAPGSFQHWVGFFDSFALGRSSLVESHEGRFGLCCAANLVLTDFLVFRPESRWSVWNCSAPHWRILAGLASGSCEIRDSVLELPTFRPRPSVLGSFRRFLRSAPLRFFVQRPCRVVWRRPTSGLFAHKVQALALMDVRPRTSGRWPRTARICQVWHAPAFGMCP